MNKSKKLDLLTCNLFTGILIFTIPLIISHVLQNLFNFADLAVIGAYSGDVSIGAMGSTTMIVNLFLGFATGFGSAINAKVAKRLGANDKSGAHHAIHSSITFTLIFGIIISGLGIALARPLLVLINTQEIFLEKASIYLMVYLAGLPATMVYNALSGVYNAAGKTVKPLIYLFIAGIANVGFNFLFVLSAHLDVLGVALGSMISQYIMAILIVISLAHEKTDYRLKIKDIKVYSNYGRELSSFLLLAGVQNSLFYVANMFVQVGVNQLTHVEVEGITISVALDNLVYFVMDAFYLACSSFIGQNYGAKNKKRIRDSYLISIGYAVFIGYFFGMIYILFGRQIYSMFTRSEDVINAAMRRTLIMGLCYGVSALMDGTTAAARGLGKTFIPLVIIMLFSFVFRVIWIFTIFQSHKTIESLYLLYVVSWALSAIFEIIYFIYIYKKSTASFSKIATSKKS